MTMRPSDYFDRNCFIGASNTQRRELARRYEIGVDNICWGNDFPHPEGTWPHTREFLAEVFCDIPRDETAAMLGDNAAEVYGFDTAALQPLVDRIGPTPDELGQADDPTAKWAAAKRPAARGSPASRRGRRPPSRRDRHGGTGTLRPARPGFVASPYEQYAVLRDEDPGAPLRAALRLVVTRFDDVDAVAARPHDVERHRAAPRRPAHRPDRARGPGRARSLGRETVVLIDDPDHTRVRKLMASRSAVREIEPAARSSRRRGRRALDQLRDEHGGAGRIDSTWSADFAYPLPVEVFSEMLGVPEEDHPQFRYWTSCVARSLDPIMAPRSASELLRGLDEMYDYLDGRSTAKRGSPPTTCSPTSCTPRTDGERSPTTS